MFVSPDRIRSEDLCLHYRFMRELFCPPVLGTKDNYWSRVGKKGAWCSLKCAFEKNWVQIKRCGTQMVIQLSMLQDSWRLFTPSCKWLKKEKYCSLTHGGARRLQDGLSLGAVHHHLLQALQTLLRQLLPVSNELRQAAVHRVFWHNLDKLGEVVAIPFTKDKTEC